MRNGRFKTLSDLEELELDHNQLTELDPRLFEANKKLTGLITCKNSFILSFLFLVDNDCFHLFKKIVINSLMSLIFNIYATKNFNSKK